MSLQEEQSREHDVRTGLSMLAGQGAHRTNVNGENKSNDQPSTTKESNSPSFIGNIHTTSGSLSSLTIKPVGSNRFVIFQYLIQFFLLFTIRLFMPTKK